MTSPSGLAVEDSVPSTQVRWRDVQAEMPADLIIQALFVITNRHLIDGRHVRGQMTALSCTLQNNPIFVSHRWDLAIGPAKQNIGLNPYAQHFLDGVLCWLGLSSPAVGIRAIMSDAYMVRSRPRSLPNCRTQPGNGRPSISPTVPPISQGQSSSVRSLMTNSFMASVT